ncbi:hypothetical protein ALC56_13032, partial [Trachymyrmex septentrionalis]
APRTNDPKMPSSGRTSRTSLRFASLLESLHSVRFENELKIAICQTYAKIPKHLIRDNANLILFKQDGINLKRVYNDHLCRKCWQQKYGFLMIDKDNALTNGRYRKGFIDFVIP